MHYSRSLVSSALVVGLSIGAAFAQDTPAVDGGAPSFSDLSKDGKFIVRSDLPKDNEALKPLRAHFPEADTDHNGKLDEAEYKAYVAKGSSRPAQPSR